MRAAAFLVLTCLTFFLFLPYRVGRADRLEFHHLLWRFQARTEPYEIDQAILTAEVIGLGLLAFLLCRPLKP